MNLRNLESKQLKQGGSILKVFAVPEETAGVFNILWNSREIKDKSQNSSKVRIECSKKSSPSLLSIQL